MTTRVLIPVADGSADLDIATLLDVLRRAGFDVLLASIEARRMLTCERGMRITADVMLLDVLAQPFDLVVLPGGAQGAERLGAHQPLAERVGRQAAAGEFFAGTGAAPALALHAYGVLRMRRVTCDPAFSDHLGSATFVEQPVVVDGNCVTAQGPGSALGFALELVERLAGRAMRRSVAEGLGASV
ncbi:DJ-1 family glyoxalase III [Stutzerimonas azotifigens]|uniref:DJ-1/PfpI family protein n=1 Tax=Stutzerimonas azotifigens TaxID=291995 RepID=A0ABR5YV58_9GAMM|nr:DJ-1 family glyoxalase III [Stutzerimonas azotifigens]MBA1271813.1 DJ-1/PfpI family protein [Stutzerimonas azotifigens]